MTATIHGKCGQLIEMVYSPPAAVMNQGVSSPHPEMELSSGESSPTVRVSAHPLES